MQGIELCIEQGETEHLLAENGTTEGDGVGVYETPSHRGVRVHIAGLSKREWKTWET